MNQRHALFPALCAAALALGLASAAQAQPSSAHVKKNIERLLGHKVGPVTVTPTATKTFYEIVVDGASMYTDSTGRYLFVSNDVLFLDSGSPEFHKRLEQLWKK